jgi:hypothetical protein
MKKYVLLGVLAIATLAYGATTYTTNYNFAKPGDGDENYGEALRDNFDSIDTNLQAVSDTTNNHIADTTAAHAATAISTTPGANICTSQTTVQAFLTCLDGVYDPNVSGVVLITGTQTITGNKTFSIAPTFSSVTSAVLTTNVSGTVTGSSFNALDPLTTKGDLTVHDGTNTTRLPVGSNDQILVADSSDAEGIVWENPNPRWRKFTYPYTSFATAATSFAVTAFTLAAGEGIDAVIIKHNTAFSGGSITAYTIEAGITGDADQYADPWDVFQSTGGAVSSATQFFDVPNFDATTDFVVTARSTGANTNAATAGSVDIYVRTFILP